MALTQEAYREGQWSNPGLLKQPTHQAIRTLEKPGEPLNQILAGDRARLRRNSHNSSYSLHIVLSGFIPVRPLGQFTRTFQSFTFSTKNMPSIKINMPTFYIPLSPNPHALSQAALEHDRCTLLSHRHIFLLTSSLSLPQVTHAHIPCRQLAPWPSSLQGASGAGSP